MLLYKLSSVFPNLDTTIYKDELTEFTINLALDKIKSATNDNILADTFFDDIFSSGESESDLLKKGIKISSATKYNKLLCIHKKTYEGYSGKWDKSLLEALQEHEAYLGSQFNMTSFFKATDKISCWGFDMDKLIV